MTNYLRIDVVVGLLAIIGGLVLIGAYLGLWWSVPATGLEIYTRIVGVVVLMVVAAIALSIVVTISDRDNIASDERETGIQLKAMRNTVFAFAGGNAIILMEAFDFADPMQLVHACIGVAIGAEAVRLASLIYYMQMGE